jgi:hypothetical protein
MGVDGGSYSATTSHMGKVVGFQVNKFAAKCRKWRKCGKRTKRLQSVQMAVIAEMAQSAQSWRKKEQLIIIGKARWHQKKTFTCSRIRTREHVNVLI